MKRGLVRVSGVLDDSGSSAENHIEEPASPSPSLKQEAEQFKGLEVEVKEDIYEFIFLDLCIEIYSDS